MKDKKLWLMIFLSAACESCGSGTSSPSSSAAFAASSTGRAGTYMICYTTSKAHGITVSSVFHVGPVDQVTMLEEPWAKAFRRYVGQSSDAGALSVTCTQVGSPKSRRRAERQNRRLA